MAKEELTQRQEKVLKFIKRSVLLTGYPPTIREIGQKLGIKSTNGVSEHLKALMQKGYLAKESGKSRSLTILVPKGKKTVAQKMPRSVPIYKSENEMRALHLRPILSAVLDSIGTLTIYRCQKGEFSELASFSITKTSKI